MDKSKLLAFVTRLGSANSHTAILARTMGIPALVGVEISEEWDGKIGIVDGYEGKFLVDPEMPVLEEFFKRKAADDEQKELLQTLKGKENITKSGQKINLYANIGNPGDLVSVMENDAGGIGLFRSEFLYLESDHYPTEDEQFQAYKREELLQEGFKLGNVEEGIMIETPAAALMSDELAKEVDFFSIGTNDLTQYTLAIDRQNANFDSFYDAHHPAVLKLIQMITDMHM